MNISEMDNESGHKGKILIPGLGLQEHMTLHILARFTVGHTSFPHGILNLADQLLPKGGATPVGLLPRNVHARSPTPVARVPTGHPAAAAAAAATAGP